LAASAGWWIWVGDRHLALAACQRYPMLRAVVFDLPEAIALAREMAAAAPAVDRLSFQAGDFFTDPLPEADLFALGRIVHDWTEDKILVLLRKIHERLPAGGAVLIVEKLLHDDRSGPTIAQLQALNMLSARKARNVPWRSTKRCCGRLVSRTWQGRRTRAPLDAVLGVKP